MPDRQHWGKTEMQLQGVAITPRAGGQREEAGSITVLQPRSLKDGPHRAGTQTSEDRVLSGWARISEGGALRLLLKDPLLLDSTVTASVKTRCCGDTDKSKKKQVPTSGLF